VALDLEMSRIKILVLSKREKHPMGHIRQMYPAVPQLEIHAGKR
jgi:hypothetical protein